MYFQLTLEGLKCAKKVRFEQKIYSTICGRNVQAIWDHKNSTRLAGGVREDQNLPQKWPQFGFGVL